MSRALKIGDSVSVQIRCFGDAYAKDKAGARWNDPDERDIGTVVAKDGDRWRVDFHDEEEPKSWKRATLRFKCRPETSPGKPSPKKRKAARSTAWRPRKICI